MISSELIALYKKNSQLRGELAQLKEHQMNLQSIKYNIVTAKAYSLWQLANKIKSVIKNPTKLKKVMTILSTEGFAGLKKRIANNKYIEKQLADINEQYQELFFDIYPSPEILQQQAELSKEFSYKPTISLVLPTYNTNETFLKECITSVLKQSYPHWELCICDDNSPNPKIRHIIEEFAQNDKRIKYTFRKENGHICIASNDAISLATGEFIGLLDHDDILWPNALFEVAQVLNKHKECDFIYTDEDKLDEDGYMHIEPFFKPDWNPDYIRSINYITHFSVIRKSLVDALGRFRDSYEGAQDWYVILRATNEISKNTKPHLIREKIVHIPTIVYSWRKSETSTASEKHSDVVKQYAYVNQQRVLQSDLEARGYTGKVLETPYKGLWRVKYDINDSPLISIIIPSKDQFAYISRCINSIVEKTSYKNYEIIIMDTGSTDNNVLQYYKTLQEQYSHINIIQWEKKFNFAAVCNEGVEHAKGEYIVLLNNDTEVISGQWIDAMLEHAQRPEVGAVGAKLLYKDCTIQHAGIFLTSVFTALHILKNYPDECIQGFPVIHSKDSVKNYAAVTAACLMVRTDKYKEVEGQDSSFEVAFNDVDFCLKLLNKGYNNVYTPYAVLYHDESVSVRRVEKGERDKHQFLLESQIMKQKWSQYITKDPFYNQNLVLDAEDFSLKKPE